MTNYVTCYLLPFEYLNLKVNYLDDFDIQIPRCYELLPVGVLSWVCYSDNGYDMNIRLIKELFSEIKLREVHYSDLLFIWIQGSIWVMLRV